MSHYGNCTVICQPTHWAKLRLVIMSLQGLHDCCHAQVQERGMDLVTRGCRKLFKGVIEMELRCSEVRAQGEDGDSTPAWDWRLRVSELRPRSGAWRM